MDREIIVVVDPMCSWCWGFSPVLTEMASEYGARVPISVLVGGLRPLTQEPMDETMKAEIRHHWEDVNKASGQPFDFSFFDRDGFVYDTEPACRAVVTVRTLKPEAVLSYLAALHRAFYQENIDITDDGNLEELAGNEGVDPNAFTKVFSSRQMIYDTAADFHRSHALGVRGFPTVLLRNDQSAAILTAGLQPFEALKPALDKWIAGDLKPKGAPRDGDGNGNGNGGGNGNGNGGVGAETSGEGETEA